MSKKNATARRTTHMATLGDLAKGSPAPHGKARFSKKKRRGPRRK